MLLAAPILSALESLFPGKHLGGRFDNLLLTLTEDLEYTADSRAAQPDASALVASHPNQTQAPEQQPMQTALPDLSERNERSIDHPDRDYYATSPWIKSFTWFIMVDIVASTVLILYQSLSGTQKLVALLIPSAQFWLWLPIYHFLVMLLFILFSFLLEEFSLRRGHRSIIRQKPIIGIFSTLALASGLLAMVTLQNTYYSSFDYAILAVFGFYMFCAGLIAPCRIYLLVYDYLRMRN